MRIITLLSLILCLNTYAHTNSNEQKPYVVTLQAHDYNWSMTWLRFLEIDIAGVDYQNNLIDVVVNDQELERLEKINFFSVTEILPELIKMRPDSDYKNPEEIEQILFEYAQAYPEIAQVEVIGESFEGRPIYALKISDHVSQTESEEPSILFNSMHHAREIMTPEVALDIINYLLTGYGVDSEVDHWVNSNEIWVVPMLNVDGNVKVWGSNSMWRKNTRGGYGVDINRNYPHRWGDCGGSSGSKWAQDYRGASAASEPETQTMMELVKKIRPVFDISYHSYSEMVLYPYGCEGERAENREVVEGIGQELGEALDYTYGTPWELLYSVDGGDIDWMYYEYQVIAYAFEVSSRSEGFQPDFDPWRQRTVEKNRAGWQLLLDRLDGPGVRGMIETAIFLDTEDFSVEVMKEGELIQVYRVNPDGSFHIILEPGHYSLLIQADGFESQTREIDILDQRVDLTLNF